MSNSVPPASTLLQAAARYLEEELMPSLEGYHRFQTRVTVNVLRMVERELILNAPQDAGADQSLELANDILSGRISIDAPGLSAQLRAGLRDALAVNNPKWAARDVARDGVS